MRRHPIAFVLLAVLPTATGCLADSETPTGVASSGKADGYEDGALCAQIREDEIEIEVVERREVLTRESWKSIDVIVGFDFEQCYDAIAQELIRIDGELFWRFTSREDHCDGGNSYGAIYTYDLTTAVAHIYDSAVSCDGWREVFLATNHVCDLAAEEHAEQKMADFGLRFTAKTSALELRRPYLYSFIHVGGELPDHGNRRAQIRVTTNIDDCTFAGTIVESIPLD